MQRTVLFMLLILGSSCQYFQTERISSEEVLKEELQTMDWSDIDTYPSFPQCDGVIEKEEQRNCFESTILASIQSQLAIGNWVTSFPLHDTVLLHLEVDTTGILKVEPFVLDSMVQRALPKMDSLLMEGLYGLERPAPAYKRGIPVTSKFTLPVVINSEDL